MTVTMRNRLNHFTDIVQKNIVLCLFFILPKKVTAVFLNLSIFSLICDIKRMSITESSINTDKFKLLLNISFNEEILLLPQYSLNWFWSEAFLKEEVTINGVTMSLTEAIRKDEILYNNLRYIIEVLIQNIPNCLKFKLNLKSFKNKLIFKHNIMNVLLYV